MTKFNGSVLQVHIDDIEDEIGLLLEDCTETDEVIHDAYMQTVISGISDNGYTVTSTATATTVQATNYLHGLLDLGLVTVVLVTT